MKNTDNENSTKFLYFKSKTFKNLKKKREGKSQQI